MKPTPYTGPYVGYTDIDAGLPCSGMKRIEGNVTMNENTGINWQTLTQLVEQERAVLTLIDGLHFTWLNNALVTCNADGTIPLNSRFIAEIDLGKIDADWQRVIRALIAASPDVVRALGPLRSEIEAARFEGRITTKGNDSTNMLSAYLLAAGKALEKFARACQPETPPCTSK